MLSTLDTLKQCMILFDIYVFSIILTTAFIDVFSCSIEEERAEFQSFIQVGTRSHGDRLFFDPDYFKADQSVSKPPPPPRVRHFFLRHRLGFFFIF